MMKLLAVDTSGRAMSASLFVDGVKKAGYRSDGRERDSHRLIERVRELLDRSKTRIDAIDALAVCVGPGSFTGVRIGVVAAQMLAHGASKKLIAVDSLQAIAARSSADRVAVALEAGRGNVYGAVYRTANGRRVAVQGPALMRREAFLSGVGAGVALMDGEAADADAVARVALAAGARARWIAPERLQPLYLYPRDCNVTRPKAR